MATTIQQSAPANSAPAPIPQPEKKFDMEHFTHQAWWFTSGTIAGLLDGMSDGGRWGLWIGAAAGLLYCIGTGIGIALLQVILPAALCGFLYGALIGAVVGTLSGGVDRMARGERHEEIASRGGGRRAMASGRTYREIYQDQDRRGDFNMERLLQQERENTRDINTYWQDRVNADSTAGRGV